MMAFADYLHGLYVVRTRISLRHTKRIVWLFVINLKISIMLSPVERSVLLPRWKPQDWLQMNQMKSPNHWKDSRAPE